MKAVKKLTALAVALGVALSAAACSNGSSSQAQPSASASSSASAASQTPTDEAKPEVVLSTEGMPTVTKDKSGNPVLSFPPGSTPPAGLHVGLITKGDGATVGSSDSVLVNYVGQVWGKPDPFDSSYSRSGAAFFPLEQMIKGWIYGFPGRHVGDTFTISIPPELGYGSAGQEQAGIGGKDTIVFYVELLGTYSAQSAGDAHAQLTHESVPVSVTGELGKPVTKIDIKQSEEPTSISATILARGSGKSIKDGSNVIVAYAVQSWDGSVFSSTWQGEPAASIPAGPQQVNVTSDPQNFTSALIGVPQGSRVLLLVPKSDGDTKTQQQATPALAYVVDVLAVMD
ncbi:MAG: FKBP-type peptidyl-prolyl cis-trans isomerase [Actinomycetaceae bacterium]|nr:FKBP-type peptidyl-prolyl cis-trans isomerase [Actinomycetaceae bacterium]MDY6083073.1 FKBP-type peptidyl-prolyl cis-trans isomerase [Actinomycetaceae bacterium]